MPQIKSSFTEMICIKWLFFRVLNQVDLSLPETRNAFQSSIDNYWRSVSSKINDFARSTGFKGIKSIINKDCQTTIYISYCYTIYILHQIGMTNLTFLLEFQNAYLIENSTKPFLTLINTETFLKSYVIRCEYDT